MKTSGKSGILIIGILIGVILGMSMAVFMDYQGFEINPFNKIRQLVFASNSEDDAGSGTGIKENAPQPGKEVYGGEEKRIALSGNDSLMVNHGSGAYDHSFRQDTVSFRNTDENITENGEDIRLATDQMVGSIMVRISGLEEEHSPNLDSLLIDDKYTGKQEGTIKIELWSSPLNYSGYKWSGNKLVVFGFFETGRVKMKYLEGSYFFNYGTLYYLVEPTNTYKNLELIQDPVLIKKLNSQ